MASSSRSVVVLLISGDGVAVGQGLCAGTNPCASVLEPRDQLLPDSWLPDWVAKAHDSLPWPRSSIPCQSTLAVADLPPAAFPWATDKAPRVDGASLAPKCGWGVVGIPFFLEF